MATTRANIVLYSLLLVGILMTSPVFSQDLKSAIRLTENEQFNDAMQEYEAVIAKEPGNGDNYYYYGESFLKSYFSDSSNVSLKEMSDKALVQFRKGIAVDSLNPLNYIGLGKLALYKGDLGSARGHFSKAESFLPSRGKKIVMPVERQVVILQKIAEAYLKSPAGDTADVFSYLRKAEKLDKKNPETYLLKGDAYLFLINDGSNAIFNYKKAQDYDPGSARAKLRLGQLWVRAKRPMDALDYYKEALDIDSTYAPAYRELAELYRLASQFDNAQKMYKKFLDLNQQNLSARVRYASFLFLSKNYNETILQCREILAQDDSYNFLNRIAGYACFETGQYDDGLKFMKEFFLKTQAEKILPSDYSYLGRILSKSGQDSLAIIEFEKAARLEPANVDHLSDMITSWNKMKKYDKAALVQERKIKLIENPTYADYLNLGKTYYQAQNWDMADSAFVRVNTMKPDLVQAYIWRARVYANKDPETKDGLAKPFYEKVIEVAVVDSVKNSKDLIESYKYLAYFFFKNKKWCESLDYWLKAEAIDPNDEQAKSAIKDLKVRCPRK